MKLVVFLFFSMLLFACERTTTIDFKLPYEGKKLVLYSFFQPNDTIRARLTESTHPLDTLPIPFVTDATVKLYEDGFFLENLVFNKKEYSSSTGFIPKVGHYYHIEAENSIGKILSDVDTIPNIPKIEEVSYEYSADSQSINVHFSFQDAMKTTDVYAYQFVRYAKNKPETISNSPFYPINCYQLQEDVTFNGKKEKVEHNLSRWIVSIDANYQFFTQETDKIQIKLYSYSPNILKTCQSLAYKDTDIGNPENKEKIIWSNIKGGYGLVAGYNLAQYSILLK